MWTWIKDKWNRFNDWLASIAPGVKTKTIAVLGALGSFGAVAQEYVSGLPLTTYVTAEKALIITGALFTLTFVTRALTNRAN